jgi:UDP-N-acetylmuramate: L-alanyl-gamma-D-glutamyl-meso-diaminopimelate ligase
LNNLEFDHADIFADLPAIETQFHHLVRTIPEQGRIVLPSGDDALERVLSRGCWSKVVRVGLTDALHSEPVSASEFSVKFGDKFIGTVHWKLNGDHNRANAVAALAAARHIGIDLETGIEALCRFGGVKRRLEIRGCIDNITVYDDFAHHPTAVQTTVEGLRRQVGAARILAVLEPRSNTMKLGTMAARLPEALQQADQIFCFGQASGKHSLGWDPREVLAPLGARASAHSDIDKLIAAVADSARPGDHILIMSNGGFANVHQRLLDTLATQHG